MDADSNRAFFFWPSFPSTVYPLFFLFRRLILLMNCQKDVDDELLTVSDARVGASAGNRFMD